MESLWPKHRYQNPGGYNTLSTVKSQVPLHRASELSDLSCFSLSALSIRWQPGGPHSRQRSSRAEFQGRDGKDSEGYKLRGGVPTTCGKCLWCASGEYGPQGPQKERYSGAKAVGFSSSSSTWQPVNSSQQMWSQEGGYVTSSEIETQVSV